MMAHIIAPRYAKAIAVRYAPAEHYGFPIRGMKTVEEVRRERLLMLKVEAGTLAALNEKLGLTSRDATLSQILNSAPNSRTGTPKQMGSKLARALEKACGKEVGWMDTDAGADGLRPDVADLAALISAMPDRERNVVLRVVRATIDSMKDLSSDDKLPDVEPNTSPKRMNHG